MVTKFAGYAFEGPFISAREVSEDAGIFLVQDMFTGFIIHIEESNNLKRAIDKSPRSASWQHDTGGNFRIWVRYIHVNSEDDRHILQAALKFHYSSGYLCSLR